MSGQKAVLKPCNRPTYASILQRPEKFDDLAKRDAKLFHSCQASPIREEYREISIDSKEKINKTDFTNNFTLKVAKDEIQLPLIREEILQEFPNADKTPKSKFEDVGDLHPAAHREQTKNNVTTYEESRNSTSLKGKSSSDFTGKRVKLEQGNEGTRKKKPMEHSAIRPAEKKETLQVDEDGWQTRKSGSKKIRNENKAPQSYRQQNLQPARGDYQRSLSSGSNQGPKDAQKFGPWGRGMRSEGRRSTVFYPTNRGGNRQGRGQGSMATFGRPTGERSYSTADRMPEKSRYRSDKTDSLSSAPNTSSAQYAEKINQEKRRFEIQTNQTPTITAAATIIRRPDLTPPPPPSCGVFSYRDVLAKGLKSPPASASYCRVSTSLYAPSFPVQSDVSFSASPAAAQPQSPSVQASVQSAPTSGSAPIPSPSSSFPPASDHLLSQSTDSLMAVAHSAPSASPISSVQCLDEAAPLSASPSVPSHVSASVKVSVSDSSIHFLPTRENRAHGEPCPAVKKEGSTAKDDQSPHRSFSPFSISFSIKNGEPSKRQEGLDVAENERLCHSRGMEKVKKIEMEDSRERTLADAPKRREKDQKIGIKFSPDTKTEKLVIPEKPEIKTAIESWTPPGKLQGTLQSAVNVRRDETVKISYSDALKKSTSSDESPKDHLKCLAPETGDGPVFCSVENEKNSVEEKSSCTPELQSSIKGVSWIPSGNSADDRADDTHELNLSGSDRTPFTYDNIKQGGSNCSSVFQSPLKVVNIGIALSSNFETETLPSETNFSVPPPTPTEESVNDPDLQDTCSMGSFAVISSVAKELESQSTKLWLQSNESSSNSSRLEESHASSSCANIGGTGSFSNTTQTSADSKGSYDGNKENCKPSGSTKDYGTLNEKSKDQSTDLPGLDSTTSSGKIGTHSELRDDFPGPCSQTNIPLTIKSVGNREIFFPDVAQSWNSSNLNSNTETDKVLPQRSKQLRRRNSAEEKETSQAESVPDGLEKKKASVNDSKRSEAFVQSDPVEEKSIPDNSSSWTMTNIDASADSYSGMAGPSLPANENKTEMARSPRTTVSSKIWTEEGSEFGLPRSNILNIDKAEQMPLDILLNSQSTSTVLKQTEYYTRCSPTKQLDKFAITSSVESLPSYTVAKTVTCQSTAPDLESFPKLSSVSSRQSDFGVNLTTVSKAMTDAPSTSESSTALASETVRSTATTPAVSTVQFTQSQTSYNQQQTQTLASSTLNVPARSEMEYPSMQRMPSVNMPPQPHLNYIQSHPPPPSLQYHSPYDPHWSRNFPMDMNQSEWLNVNRYANPDRDFSRPPPPLHAIHPVPQAMNYFNYPSPMQAQKDGIFSNYNYPPSPFQPAGYRFQTLPPFVQRPPPPLPSHFNSGMFGRPYDNRGALPHRFSPEYRAQSNFSVSQKQYNDGDRVRVAAQIPSHYREDVNSNAVPTYKSSGGGNQPDNRFSSRDQRNGNRPLQSHHPQDPTLGDFLPRQLDNYRSDKMPQDFGLSHSWKKSYEKKSFGNGRKNYKSEQKDEHYMQVGNAESFRDQEQPGDIRRKNPYKGPANHNDELSKHANKLPMESKSNFQQGDAVKVRGERDLYAGGASGYQEKYPFPPYQQNSDMYLNHLMPTMMPPVELNLNTVASPYLDVNKDISGEKQASGTIVADYSSSHLEKTDYDEQVSQVSSLACENIQDFCTGGWKYYNDAISSPSGLRIHQSTYVPYVNPCGPVPPAYLATDVRARVQWLGFPKAHEAYTARINSQRSLRMDVTVVCSKGSAVCCNSDILGTCSSYFYERLVGRTEEYITIFVNIPSKIMKHFLQMMSCGEAFVPMNDVNDVIMRAPVYLNLNP